MTTTTIRVLHEPIKNPRPDGRKRNWTGEKTFPAGRYIVTENRAHRSGLSRYDNVDIYSNKEGLLAIVAASEEVGPQGIAELLYTLDAEDYERAVLGLLLRDGVITRGDISLAVKQLNGDENLFDKI